MNLPRCGQSAGVLGVFGNGNFAFSALTKLVFDSG